MEFQPFPKIARLARDIVVSEKIDGTNAQVCIGTIADVMLSGFTAQALARSGELLMLAGSRSKYLAVARERVKSDDNFGFAKWVYDHADELWALGAGRHYGEWWGSGIQRGYGLTNGEKRFSLFNVARWGDDRDREKFPGDRPACCAVVPVLYRGPFCEGEIDASLDMLRMDGSYAARGFQKPEGVVVFHTASGTLYKRTIENDEEPKALRVSAGLP
jgi:hypothetical protein